MTRYVLVFLAFAAILLPGIAHGLWIGRWVRSEELERSVGRLSQVPWTIADWQGEDSPLDGRQLARAGVAGCISRRYTHRVSRHSLVLLVACGRPGPVAVHTPDICYENSGYEVVSEGKQTISAGVSDAGAEFKSSVFAKPGAAATSVQVYWAWSAGGPWQVPVHPRLTFGGTPALHKLYVLCSFSNKSQRKEVQEACTSFLRALLPQLEASLFERTVDAVK